MGTCVCAVGRVNDGDRARVWAGMGVDGVGGILCAVAVARGRLGARMGVETGDDCAREHDG